jgi:aminopeptidase N
MLFTLIAAIAPSASGEQTASTPVSPATPAANVPSPGAAGIGDPYFPLLGNGGYDALHYTLDLDLDIPAGSLRDATATVDAIATQALSSFNLDFRGPEIDAVTVDGLPATWSREGGELTIVPATPIANDARFETRVRYHGKPDSGGEDRFKRGWWATGDSIFTVGEPAGSDVWYPVNGHPLDKATYTLNVTVPEPYDVVANGQLASIAFATGAAGNPSTRTFTWENQFPTASYLVLFHAADLDVDTRVGPDGITLIDAFPPDFSSDAAQPFTLVPEMLAVYDELFGPYPFASLGNTVFADTSFNAALETQTMIGYDGSATSERMIAHEVAHQWFGDSVSLKRWRDIWLNEGFARYAEALWAEAAHGPRALDAAIRRDAATLATSSRTPNGEGVIIGDPGPAKLFSEVVYAGGALLLHELRGRLGDDDFFTLLQEWAARHEHANATTDDFIALAEEISGQNLDDFFAEWLTTPWTPERVAALYPLEATPMP